MPRQVRIEFAGAMYHVMARGDRREAIVQDDEDRSTWERTLGQACERAGMRVHAYVLMTNHYHLLLETREGNLSRGVGWLQNAFTRRINTRHRLWGHVFGGRYKAVLVEPGNCFWALLDYIHLNPVRAGLVREGEGLESYRWSSLRHYIAVPKMRPSWLETAMALSVTGCKDTAAARREFLEMLESRVDWKDPSQAGVVYSERERELELSVYSALRRGWFFGSQEFREKLLKLAAKTLAGRAKRKADGYQGAELKDHGERRAERILRVGLEHFGVSGEELRSAAKGDWRKGLLAALIQKETTVRLDWICQKLGMGERSYCCRTIRRTREVMERRRDWIAASRKIQAISINHD
jgi:putative transposase